MKQLTLLLTIIGMLVFADVIASSKDYALHQAVLDQDIQLVKKLLSRGAAVDVIGSRKYGYGSALHLAVREGHLDIAKLLLDRGAQVDVFDPDDFTPLHNAAWNGNLEMTELLLAAGADIEASTYDGDTPLTLAQNNNQPKVAKYIQAKLLPSAITETKVESVFVSDPEVIDVSGTYVMTNLSGSAIDLKGLISRPKSKDIHEVTIVQNGNQITGTYDAGKGKIWGEIEGHTVRIRWLTSTNAVSGKGKWTIKPVENQMVGDITFDVGTGYGTGNAGARRELILTKIETAPILDISGTYTSEITHKDLASHTPKSSYFGLRPKIEVKIEHNSNAITGTISGDRSGDIKGVLSGNRITFNFDSKGGAFGDVRGEGIWVVSDDPDILNGTWKTSNKGNDTNGVWNLTKIETTP